MIYNGKPVRRYNGITVLKEVPTSRASSLSHLPAAA